MGRRTGASRHVRPFRSGEPFGVSGLLFLNRACGASRAQLHALQIATASKEINDGFEAFPERFGWEAA